MAAKAKKPPASSKSNRPITLKHLVATLAEEHQLTKCAGEALLSDLVGLITKHLKICGLWHPADQEARSSFGSLPGNR
jgi:hypothetical protein